VPCKSNHQPLNQITPFPPPPPKSHLPMSRRPKAFIANDQKYRYLWLVCDLRQTLSVSISQDPESGESQATLASALPLLPGIKPLGDLVHSALGSGDVSGTAAV
jgi:hypothetical protein